MCAATFQGNTSVSQNRYVVTAGSSLYYQVAGHSPGQATEQHVQLVYRSAGVFSNIGYQVIMNDHTGAGTVTSRKNAANGNQTFSIGASSLGYFEDTTHTDTIAAGDKLNTKLASGTGGTDMKVECCNSIFTATTNTVTKLAIGANNLTPIQPGTTKIYVPISGCQLSSTLLTTETNAKCRVTHAGTVRNLVTNSSASFGTNPVLTTFVRKNAADTTITIASGTLAFVEDVTHTATVAAGDDINYSCISSGTNSPSFNVMTICCEYENTSGYGMCFATDTAANNQVDNTTVFGPLGGNCAAASDFQFADSGSETDVKLNANAAFTFSNIGIITTGADTPTSTATFRKDTGSGSANGNLTITSTGSTGGYYEDTTHTDVVAATDKINYTIFAQSKGGTHFANTAMVRISSFISSGAIDMTNASTLTFANHFITAV